MEVFLMRVRTYAGTDGKGSSPSTMMANHLLKRFQRVQRS